MHNRKTSLGLLLVLLLMLCATAACGNASSPAAGNKSDAAARTFTDAYGTIEAPEHPKRVIGLYLEDALVALGVKPVMQFAMGNFTIGYLQDELKDAAKLDIQAYDFEAVLQAKPDLILLGFPSFAMDERYNLFSKIAPTYVFEDAASDWRKTLREVGSLLNKSDEAEQVLAAYEDKAAQARSQLEQSVGRETVALLRIDMDKVLRLYGGPNNYTAPVLYDDLNLEPAPIVKKLVWGEESFKDISMELLPEIDADHLFLVVNDDGKELAEEMMATSLWHNIPAVKAGHVHQVSEDVWMTFGVLAQQRKIDDVLNALAKPQ
ncbi:ABC transporter substrate-binding protein [Cohnella fermenti]|nr:ABC transporter substrate-binding protein [Cohnella fermenti]